VENVFQQTIGISMGTNCVLLLSDLFLYSYKGFLRKKRKEANPILKF